MTTENKELEVAELESLKSRADLLGISYHPNISAERLSERIEKHQEEQKEKTEAKTAKATKGTSVSSLRREAEKLVRINVTCMNPAKREWEGEIITGGNSVVGTHKKYVPFNTTEGWHVPNIIYQILKSRKCQIFQTVKGHDGSDVRESKMIREFSIEVMDPLTPKELAELERRQAMRRGKDV